MEQETNSEIIKKGRRAKAASFDCASIPTERKNRFLSSLSKALTEEKTAVLAANEKDLERGAKNGLSAALLDRLKLNDKRIEDIALSLTQLADLPDPVGEVLQSWRRPNGLELSKVRVPFGVIGIIYEARPNVTVDSAAICFKTGNACLLRGSSSALDTNLALVKVIRGTLTKEQLPEDAIQLIEDTRRESIVDLLQASSLVDCVIPRGGADLIQFVVRNSVVPVIETGAGNCHLYIDGDADPEMAISICSNAKTQRPSVCNAIETVLVHKEWAARNLKSLVTALQSRGVECRGCEVSRLIADSIKRAEESDWATEYLDLILAVKVVDDVESAIDHINTYGTRHSEAIISSSPKSVEKFFSRVDAAALYHNASTRFTDGFEFGFGAEIDISTQKLHARGPMGLAELTSYKYLVRGHGQVRE
ncbi:MAG: glutamate-5-semialdehyde dehydrogenase [Deltaproteobacteria bacterium]|nr:glutamate-5-semialdehyde dehydrogenase [Deltaproteobacteria bacterium]